MALFAAYDNEMKPGDHILPGMYGAILMATPHSRILSDGRQQGSYDKGWYLAQETILEMVRQAGGNHLPSRLRSAFAFEQEEHALGYAGFHRRRFLYTVELTDAASAFRADFNLLGWPPANEPYWPWMFHRAVLYWQAENIEVPEVLTLGALQVLTVAELEHEEGQPARVKPAAGPAGLPPA